MATPPTEQLLAAANWLEQQAWRKSAVQMMESVGLAPDPWQEEFLASEYRRALLLCSRRSGKTTAAAVKALQAAMFAPPEQPATVLLFAPAGKQSTEMLETIHRLYRKLNKPVPRETERQSVLDFENGSRIMPMTANEDTSVGFTPTLIIIDEAARVPDALYDALKPMLALGKCQLIALSTPFGKRGWFWREWFNEKRQWKRVRVTADDCPRITKEFLEDERRGARSESWWLQEYFCSFEQVEGLVYPDLAACVSDLPSPWPEGRYFAGVDWGYHNPAAILVGMKTADDVLWLLQEVYGSRMTNEDLTRRAGALADTYPIEMFYCDPAEPGSIHLFRRNNLPGREGMNRILPGIQAVTARINTGRLKVSRACTNLLAEAGLYRYPTPEERKIRGENPIDENNHALAALRYMVCGIDRVRDLNARAPRPAEPLAKKPADPEEDYTLPRPKAPPQRIDLKRAEEEFDQSEEAKRLNREHLWDNTFESWGGFGAANW
ncbi:MAG TPA: terminase large subunit [Gemmataceae bacterium]|nr:terminase large subunit [Gemmataceae bacterium]